MLKGVVYEARNKREFDRMVRAGAEVWERCVKDQNDVTLSEDTVLYLPIEVAMALDLWPETTAQRGAKGSINVRKPTA